MVKRVIEKISVGTKHKVSFDIDDIIAIFRRMAKKSKLNRSVKQFCVIYRVYLIDTVFMLVVVFLGLLKLKSHFMPIWPCAPIPT